VSGNDEKEKLLGLFSTKLSNKPINPKSNTESGGNLHTTQSSVSSHSGGAHSNKGATVGSRTELSPLANTVMREARRELGNDTDLQSNNQNVSEHHIADAVDKVLRRRNESLDDVERATIIIHLQKDLLGWGVLQPLIDNKEVTDIHVYDYKTVVLQRGKVSESTGLHWPSHSAYVSFLDRLLLRLGKSVTTQQHTVDCALPNGIRICAVHESVCGQRGPLLCIRVPRVMETSLENIVAYQVAPPLIVNYLAALVRSGHCTFMVAGETGTGKTTLMKCLGTQFGPDESIVAVEDAPELNFTHPFYRSLVSRPPNSEGVGEVTLQEHIKTTLRMTPTRVILGEMRNPGAAEAFLESAQTGHVGMSTVHARNARETLVRLESLLGRAQKSVSIDIIRQQIALAVDSVIWLFREKETGKPRIGEIVEVGHFVEGQIQVRPMFKLIKTGQNPAWRLESWSSNFDDILSENGIYLGESPQEFGFAKKKN
jgi:pilus assembly protein CpaF